jgi:hypothetical protein
LLAGVAVTDGDPVEDELVVLEREKKNYHVWEVRTGEGKVVVQTRERGGVGAYQNLHQSLSATMGSRAQF